MSPASATATRTHRQRPSSPLSIRRTSTPSKSPHKTSPLISPFLLSPTSISLTSPPPLSKSRLPAIWLHLPVTLHPVPTPAHALTAVSNLSLLRHPNLEQCLGAVLDGLPSRIGPALVLERVPGHSLHHLLASKRRKFFVNTYALSVALDLARALVYFHARNAQPHAALSAHNVLFDQNRSRAVLLLAVDKPSTDDPCTPPEVRKRSNQHPRFPLQADAYSLAMLIVRMYAVVADAENPFDHLPKRLQPVVAACLRKDYRQRQTVDQLCQALADCVDVVQ